MCKTKKNGQPLFKSCQPRHSPESTQLPQSRLQLWIVVLLTALIWSMHASSSLAAEGKHALLVGISRYPSDTGAAQLDGVTIDLNSARRMAHAMGVDDGAIVELRNADATKANIRRQLEQLNRKVQQGDRVFVYFSGHGTRVATDTGCEEGYLTYDNEVLNHQDMAQYTGPMSQRAEKLVTMIDACFSGGVVATGTRSMKSPPNGLVAKFVSRTSSNEGMCSVEGVNNRTTRSLLTELGRFGINRENFVEIAAAKRDEVSWEITGEGGLVTKAVSQCLLGDSQDINGSGAVSLDEVRVCAQKKVNERMAGNAPFGQYPSTIQITGNRNLVVAPTVIYVPPVAVPAPSKPTPMVTALTTISAPVPTLTVTSVPVLSPPSPPSPPPSQAVHTPIQSAPTPPPASPPIAQTHSSPPLPVSVVATPPASKPTEFNPPVKDALLTQAPQSTKLPVVSPPPVLAAPYQPPVAEPAPNEPVGALATMYEIYQQRDPRRGLNVHVSSNSLRIGRDELAMTVNSAVDGYVYVVLLGSDAQSFYLLFPNKIDRDNRIKANQAMRLPRPGWSVGAGGPEGTDKLLVIVSQSPRDPKIFVANENAGGGAFTDAIADLKGRSRLMDFFVGKGVRGRSLAMSAALIDIREIP